MTPAYAPYSPSKWLAAPAPSRAEIATRAMVEILGSRTFDQPADPIDEGGIAADAVRAADALLAELAKPAVEAPAPDPMRLAACGTPENPHAWTPVPGSKALGGLIWKCVSCSATTIADRGPPVVASELSRGARLRDVIDSKAHEITDGLFRDPDGRMGSVLILDAKDDERISEWTRADTHTYVFQKLRQLVNSIRIQP